MQGMYSASVTSDEIQEVSVVNDLGNHQQLGTYSGWSIYFDSYIETDISGYGFYQLAPMIMQELNNDVVVDTEHSEALSRFGAYINKIFSTTNMDKASKLEEFQLIELFNLAYNVNISKWDNSLGEVADNNQLAKLSDIHKDLISVSESLELYFENKLNCPINMSWNRIKDKPIIAITLTVAEDLDDSGLDTTDEILSCYNQIDTPTYMSEALWVENIKVRYSKDLSMNRLAGKARKILSRELKEHTKYNPLGVNGYSKEKLVSLADTVSKLYYQSGGRKLTIEQQDLLLNELSMLYKKRALSFTSLVEIAGKLKVFYRNNGFIMSTVYIPKQDFSNANGTVYLSAQSGVLGKVKLSNDDKQAYSDDIINEIFETYLKRGVTTDISKTYYKLSLLPGLKVNSGLFEAGDEAGETNLIIDVDKRWGEVALAADNYGSKSTGENRTITSANWFNPLGYGDKLAVGYLHAFNPDNSQLGFLEYQYPLSLPNLYLGIGHERNSFSATKTFGGTIPTLVQGETIINKLTVNQNLLASKDINLSIDLVASHKSSIVSSKIASTANSNKRDESSKTVDLGMNLDFLMSSIQTALLIDLTASTGVVEKAESINADSHYDVALASINTSTLIRINNRIKPKLSIYSIASYSSNVLPSYEQFTIGGPDKVKAFTSSVFVGDSGVYGKIELGFDVFDFLYAGKISSTHQLETSVFFEKSAARLNSNNDIQSVRAEVSGYGAALKYNWRRDLSINSSISYVDNQSSKDDFQFVEKGRHGNIYASIRYVF